jgi:hypothetical protein
MKIKVAIVTSLRLVAGGVTGLLFYDVIPTMIKETNLYEKAKLYKTVNSIPGHEKII